TDVAWETVYRSSAMRIWYGAGRVRPGPLFPSMTVRAVVVMHHSEPQDRPGRPRLEHQADLFLQTDSKAAALIIRLIGPSIPPLTVQSLGQLELFFSGMTSYLQRHPDKAGLLFSTPDN